MNTWSQKRLEGQGEQVVARGRTTLATLGQQHEDVVLVLLEEPLVADPASIVPFVGHTLFHQVVESAAAA